MFKAVTEINHGNEDGTVTTFAEGDTVTGLSEDTMKELYEAGSIKKEEDVDDESKKDEDSADSTTTVEPVAKPTRGRPPVIK